MKLGKSVEQGDIMPPAEYTRVACQASKRASAGGGACSFQDRADDPNTAVKAPRTPARRSLAESMTGAQARPELVTTQAG